MDILLAVPHEVGKMAGWLRHYFSRDLHIDPVIDTATNGFGAERMGTTRSYDWVVIDRDLTAVGNESKNVALELAHFITKRMPFGTTHFLGISSSRVPCKWSDEDAQKAGIEYYCNNRITLFEYIKNH